MEKFIQESVTTEEFWSQGEFSNNTIEISLEARDTNNAFFFKEKDSEISYLDALDTLSDLWKER